MNRPLHKIPLILLLTLAPCITSAAAPPNTNEEGKKAAQKMFEAGDGLYESGRFEEAIAAFKNSYDLVASPNSRLMLARSLREAGHNTEASEEFRGTIRDAEASGGRYPEAMQAAQSELLALENSLATIELAPGLREQVADLAINGKPVKAAASTIPVVAGKLRITYRLKDGSNHGTTIELAKGQKQTVELDQSTESKPALSSPTAAAPVVNQPPLPPAAPNSTLRTAAWISVGVGVVGLSTFGAFGYLNRKTFRDLDAECRNDRCSVGSTSKIDEGRRYQLMANVGLGVAVVGAAAATTLFVLSPRREPERPRIALQASATGLLVNGEF
jgi:hypothetical protein